MKWKILVAFVFVVLAHLFRSAIITGQFQNGVHNHAPGECHLVPGIAEGSEDMVLLDDGKVLITTGLQDKDARHLPCFENIRGGMALFDFNKPLDKVKPVEVVGYDEVFNPHGLTFKGPHQDGTYTIYIVNHASNVDHVIRFTLNKEKTRLEATRIISDPAFGSLNDVQVVGDNDEFFVTNMQYYNTYYALLFENFFFFNWGQLLYFDGHKATAVVDGLGWPNGLNVSPDRKFLYMAECLNRKFHVYRLLDNNSIKHKETADLYTSPDNIEVSSDGDVWIGCHPRIWSIYSHIHGRSLISPGQVLRLGMRQGHVTEVHEVYADTGHRIQGTSAAIRYNDSLIIGTVTHKAAVCKINTLAV